MKKAGVMTVTARDLGNAVVASLKKYKKTYQLLARYDRSPKSAPKYKAKHKVLRASLRALSK